MKNYFILNLRFVYICEFVFCFLLVLLVSSVSGADTTSGMGSEKVKHSPKEAGIEFQRLCKIKGHFSGGDWNDDVDKWMGKKHQLMLFLQDLLVVNKAPKKEVIRIMGNPNQNLEKTDLKTPVFSDKLLQKIRAKSWDEIIIYNWRGHHDFLYFVFTDNVIIDSDWWFAREK